MIFVLAFAILATAYGAPATDCPMICPFIYLPLCGSDGTTYSNECSLKVDNCVNNRQVTKVQDGVCPSAAALVTETTTMTMPPTTCPMICPMNYMPLCGSDGHTYGNECDLKVHNCVKKVSITKVHDGNC